MIVLRWILALAIPFFLAAVVTTLTIQPWYPHWEYAKADFPADTYGWTQAERLDLSLVSVNFLRSLGSADDTIYMLEEQTFPDSDELLFTQNEVDHMHDVKVRTNIIRTGIWILGLVILVGLYALSQLGTMRDVWLTLRMGGISAFVILIGFAVLIGLAWNWFFTTFHEVLFPAGNWAFPYSSSLIRLFPEKFWFDVGIVIVGGTLGLSLLLTLLGTLFANNR